MVTSRAGPAGVSPGPSWHLASEKLETDSVISRGGRRAEGDVWRHAARARTAGPSRGLSHSPVAGAITPGRLSTTLRRKVRPTWAGTRVRGARLRRRWS